MTAPEQSTAESRPVVWVSDEVIDAIADDDLTHLPSFPVGPGAHPRLAQRVALDLRESRAREAKQAEEIASLTAALAEAQAQAERARNAALEEAAAGVRDFPENIRRLVDLPAQEDLTSGGTPFTQPARSVRMECKTRREDLVAFIRSLKTEPRP